MEEKVITLPALAAPRSRVTPNSLSFRLPRGEHGLLSARAEEEGKSPGKLAREMLTRMLHGSELERVLDAVQALSQEQRGWRAELQGVRSELRELRAAQTKFTDRLEKILASRDNRWKKRRYNRGTYHRHDEHDRRAQRERWLKASLRPHK